MFRAVSGKPGGHLFESAGDMAIAIDLGRYPREPVLGGGLSRKVLVNNYEPAAIAKGQRGGAVGLPSHDVVVLLPLTDNFFH